MNGVLGYHCAHIGSTGPGKPEDGEMTLPSRHRIRNSRPGGLMSSMLPLGHGGSPLLRVDGGQTFFSEREPNPEL